ncbi:hypothetical protein AVEN_97944-1 [Araneus ventricosus]|uniref:RNase H type-1 domain-containing protein n=1 Tax=Araneus ventricosus TaxID=182803 RepID=A0A4Y2QEF6_ARAVE|nr:hypothetical protein AVEN_97944-1 [Araneus ventricosus]
MSALETLSHYDIQMHPVALKILSILHFLRKEGFNIIFCWVPSHMGISGNEIADSTAKFASSFLSQDIPYSDVKKSYISHLHTTWQNNWDLQMNNKLHFVKPFIDKWPVLPKRELDVKLTRLRIRHTRFTHKHLIFGERTPACPTCHTDFTINHILIECPTFKSHREYHFNSPSLTLQDLLALSSSNELCVISTPSSFLDATRCYCYLEIQPLLTFILGQPMCHATNLHVTVPALSQRRSSEE